MDTTHEGRGARDHTGQHRSNAQGAAREDGGDADARYAHIPGWGADLDHRNRPAYPMERTPPRLEGVRWTRPEDQPLNMKVYHSVERPGLTPLFGTSAPPSALSGKVRDAAYRISENDIRHWLLLMLADRINTFEGIGSDLMSGRVPNVLGEMGIKAEWRHNKAGLARKVAIASLVAGSAYLLLRRRRGGAREWD